MWRVERKECHEKKRKKVLGKEQAGYKGKTNVQKLLSSPNTE